MHNYLNKYAPGVEYTYGTPMSVLPSFAERKRVWVFRRCTLSMLQYRSMSVNTTSARRWRVCVVLCRRRCYSAAWWSAAAGIWLPHRRSFPAGLGSRRSVRRSISVFIRWRWPLISFTRCRGNNNNNNNNLICIAPACRMTSEALVTRRCYIINGRWCRQWRRWCI